MFEQTFQVGDLAGVGALVVLEALLSADNALVLAIMVRHLPRKLQQKALLYGLGGAFVFRLIAILFASVVLQQWWLQAVGAIYLLFLPIKHFRQHGGGDASRAKPVGAGFWQTVIAVELTDIAFAIDSVLAGVTFIDNRTEKLWVVYFGAVIGIILLRFAAGMFIKLLDRYPVLDHVAYLLVGWVGVKLAFLAGHSFDRNRSGYLPFTIPEMPPVVFWGVLLGIAVIGGWIAIARGSDGDEPDEASKAIDGESGETISRADHEATVDTE
jgi:YkoY family integral membrane protein